MKSFSPNLEEYYEGDLLNPPLSTGDQSSLAAVSMAESLVSNFLCGWYKYLLEG